MSFLAGVGGVTCMALTFFIVCSIIKVVYTALELLASARERAERFGKLTDRVAALERKADIKAKMPEVYRD